MIKMSECEHKESIIIKGDRLCIDCGKYLDKDGYYIPALTWENLTDEEKTYSIKKLYSGELDNLSGKEARELLMKEILRKRGYKV